MRPVPDKNYNKYQAHKKPHLQRCKKYSRINREQVLERVHRYAENNRDKIKIYYQKKKEQILQKMKDERNNKKVFNLLPNIIELPY